MLLARFVYLHRLIDLFIFGHRSWILGSVVKALHCLILLLSVHKAFFSILELSEEHSMCLYKGHRAEHLMSLLVKVLLHAEYEMYFWCLLRGIVVPLLC